jgi:RNA polymerase sigma-70 factor, ECF subfamily
LSFLQGFFDAESRMMAGIEEEGVPTTAPDYPSHFAELYARSGGHRFGLSLQDFVLILQEVTGRYLAPHASKAEAAELHRSLRLEDLVLARACARGNELAWECFLNQYRAKLFMAAAAIAKEELAARELADSVYADLFGTRQNENGERISKLASYTGRGSLEGWLRTVLAQEHVNWYRGQRRLVSFEERHQRGEQFEVKSETGARVDSRLEQAIDEALAEVPADERLLLASWYLDGRTLAEIARMLGVHESTVSRRIDRITASLRKRILRGLRERGMDARAAEEAMEVDVRDVLVDVRSRLVQGKGA